LRSRFSAVVTIHSSCIRRCLNRSHTHSSAQFGCFAGAYAMPKLRHTPIPPVVTSGGPDRPPARPRKHRPDDVRPEPLTADHRRANPTDHGPDRLTTDRQLRSDCSTTHYSADHSFGLTSPPCG
jgi:hypothetical protein